MGSQNEPLSLSEYRYILQNDLASFMQCAFHELNAATNYVPGSHIEVIASKLEACRRGEIRRLIVNLPPRNLKSHCVSISFPAWLLGHNPAEQIICASYGQDLADKLGRDTRTLMNSAMYQAIFPTRLGERQSVHDFFTTEMGGRLATSVGGALTGRGANFIILDDPLKPDEAVSGTLRQKANDWYDNTLLSRLNDKATSCIIIVMQRLHQDDLVGHVLDQDDWEVLSFSAIAETEEVHRIESPLGTREFRRKPGEALHPERESLETLARIRRENGEYNFAGQYQQNPTPLGGNMVKPEWFKYFEPGAEPANFPHTFQSWDTANKPGELNDYSVCTTWGVRGIDYYLLDVFRKKLNYPDLKRAVIALRQRYPRSTVIIEDKSSGTPLIQELKRERMVVKAYTGPPGNDKVMRLHTQAIFIENGHVILPREAPWLQDYIAELTGFPGTSYDDQVDSTTQFLDYMRQPGARPMVISREALARMRLPRPYWHKRYIPCFF